MQLWVKLRRKQDAIRCSPNLSFGCAWCLQVLELGLHSIDMLQLLPAEPSPTADFKQAYTTAVQQMASTLGQVRTLKITSCGMERNALRLTNFGAEVGCEAMVRALAPAAHHMADFTLVASPTSNDMSHAFVAAMGQVLGPRTHTLELADFYGASGRPKLWESLLTALPKLTDLHIKHSQVSPNKQNLATLGLSTLPCAADAAQRPLVLHVDSHLMRSPEARQLAAGSSMLSEVWVSSSYVPCKWGPGGGSVPVPEGMQSDNDIDDEDPASDDW